MLKAFVIAALLLTPLTASSMTANRVWFEFHPGFYRVYVEYTVPGIRQLRNAVAEFTSKKKAEAFYFKILRGGDFVLVDPTRITFPAPHSAPDPW